jgi:hypothetical protein
MKSQDIENLYHKINGHILLVAAYTGNDYLKKIIKSCRMKPYSVFNNTYTEGTKFEQHWVDEFGNSMRFKDKTPYLIYNDSEISTNTRTSTDLFYGWGVQKVSQNSRFALIASTSYFEKSCYLVAFYGEDEYIRAFLYNGKWNKISPLMLGLNTLEEYFKNIDSPWIIDIDDKKIDKIFGQKVNKCIMTAWKPKQNILNHFDDEVIIEIL